MHKCNLILHCGAHQVPREELHRVTMPRRTATWQPVPHHDLLNLIEGTLPRYGMRVVEQAHAITHDGMRYFGLLQIANGSSHSVMRSASSATTGTIRTAASSGSRRRS